MNDQNNQETSQSASQNDEKSSGNKAVAIGAVVLLLVALAVAAFLMFTRGGAENGFVGVDDLETTQQMPAQDVGGTGEMVAEDVEGPIAEGDVREITVEGFSYGYSPSELTMQAGEMVRLTFVSTDMMHDFVIEGTDIATEIIAGGSETTIEFAAPEEPGTYTFYCSVTNHRALGMEGTIIVE